MDKQLVGFKEHCSFRQPGKLARYGIKSLDPLTTCQHPAAGRWSSAPERRGHQERLTRGRERYCSWHKGWRVAPSPLIFFFTRYELCAEQTMVSMVGKSKPEQRSALKHLRSHSDSQEKQMYAADVYHASISQEACQRPKIILDYKRCKGNMDNLDKVCVQ